MDGFGVPEYFEGANVFVTGGTGFMGKVLIEKLLRSCPKIGMIYILLRAKKGASLDERLKTFYEKPVFERVRKELPGDLEKKVVPIEGDVSLLGLGISEEQRQILFEKVDIVFHVAATVRFDQPLGEAILLNTRGTREVCSLVLEMKKVKMVLHVSTAYCQTDKKVIEECMYPPHADWCKAIQMAETVDNETLECIAPIFMAGFPNTYTFTKSLAENIVYDMLNDKVPNIIVRPTIVISAVKEPLPGWNDNFNGPVGLLIACGTGLVRITFVKNIRADYVPVDGAIKSFLMATWRKGTRSRPEERKKTTVYNCSSNGLESVMMDELANLASDLAWECPFDKCVWYPSKSITSNNFIYYLNVLMFHLLPAVVLDAILKLLKFQPMIVKVQRRIYNATMALQYFLMNEWTFDNTNLYSLESELLEKDRASFSYEVSSFVKDEYFRNALFGAKKYLLMENMEDLDKHRKKFQILYYVDVGFKVLSYGAALYFFYKSNILGAAYRICTDYFGTL